ncbi:unnamed protein product [Mytilus coruscus]|uniref:Uncharacterized protein n=1 Tax=Mytilus coruscus TaxID=42192 RepID=A0A6J8BVR8_MYTCO|nr:unnamed protein product [Mytilus coruscus]
MAGTRATKQWSFSKEETITSFEALRQNLQYTLSLDQNFAAFLADGFTWLKKTNANPLRGIADDGEEVAEANRRTATQKCTHLDLMLGQIANYCPIISRNTIIKNSTSINSIWQLILSFLEPNERPEDLFQRLASFIEDNLLRAGGNIHHHGEVPEADEELSPSLENLIVLTRLRLIHRDLPNLVKQRYGTELRSCKYLPDEDKQYMSRVRQSYCTEVGDSESEDNVDNEQVSFLNDNVGHSKLRVVSALRRVSTKQSPYFKAFYKHFPLELTLDTGAEVNNAPEAPDNIRDLKTTIYIDTTHTSHFSKQVSVDPDNLLSPDLQTQFKELLRKFSEVFSPNFEGYNEAIGPFEASVNMGPVQPPQRKGRMPQYSKNNLVELKNKFDELECKGVFRKPEDVGVSVEYIKPSFLVKKASGGFRLVTAFADVGRYSKPQPSLMPDVDSTLRTIAQGSIYNQVCFTSAFYHNPLANDSMKYCGVATPYRGDCVYTRSAMGMPGSETALEELMCRIVEDFLQKGCVAKLADDLFCGGNTPEELLHNWECVLQSLQKSGICLSPSKTVICPKSITILGWICSQGSISASTHRVATLASCPVPDTVPAPLEETISGMKSADKIIWSDVLREHFEFTQKSLSSCKAIMLPKCSDQLWIVADGYVTKRGIGATLYINRDGKVFLAGFFSAKLRKHQVLWLPCEIEALSIAASVKHFSPFIIQSKLQANVLTDNKPCVQGFEKLCRGEFSASPRVTSFLSVVSRYQVSVNHLSGRANIPSDFASRNAPLCTEPNCQNCCFISRTEDSVVRAVSIQDLLNDEFRLPFTTRSAWINIQSECPDLRRTHAHLKQGTRPFKKLTNKGYLNVASIAKDGLLVVRRCDPLAPPNEFELIIVPRSVLDGLVTALHIKLDHPSKHQLILVLKRHFYALDKPKVTEQASDSCHTCASLKRFPKSLVEQSSEDPPDFEEKLGSLRDGLIRLLIPLKPLNGPSVVGRIDPAPGFRPLCDDSYLKQLNISIGRVKNQNKNPVVDKAIAELEDELLREERDQSPLSVKTLVIVTTRLNSRLRQRGLSSRKLWTQRNQFTHEQLPISDMNLIRAQHEARNKNHGFSEISKCSRPGRPIPDVSVGDLVYLYTDRSKTQSRDRHLVVARDGECVHQNPRNSQNEYNEESDFDDHDEDSLPKPIPDLPPARAEPPPILICENIDDVENLDEPTGLPDNSLERDITHSKSSNEDNKRVLR